MNRCRLALDLLQQTARENSVDAVLISEPTHNPGNWIYGQDNSTAIWITGFNNKKRDEDKDVSGQGFTATKLTGHNLVSIYISPNNSTSDYIDKMVGIAAYIKKLNYKQETVIIGGDYNAKSIIWG